jgi:hypothetical protein
MSHEPKPAFRYFIASPVAALWGWFGEPWGARYNENAPRVPVPDGEVCPYCSKTIRPTDSGVSIPCLLEDGFADTLSYHRLCFIREITAPGDIPPDP